MTDIPKPIWTSNRQTVLYRHGDVEQIVAANAALRAELERLTAERDALRAELGSLISQFHHAMNDAGWHPGRTDDNLCDIIREKGKEMEAMKKSWMMLAEASIEFAEHLKPEMSPQDAAMTVKLREIFDSGRKGAT